MDSMAKSILVLGSVLTILGLGTWALVADATLRFAVPALFGAGFLAIGCTLQKTSAGHRHLHLVALLMAMLIVVLGTNTLFEALRSGHSAQWLPLTLQQVVAALFCATFALIAAYRLIARPAP